MHVNISNLLHARSVLHSLSMPRVLAAHHYARQDRYASNSLDTFGNSVEARF